MKTIQNLFAMEILKIFLLPLVTLVSAANSQAQSKAQTPSDHEIMQILIDRIDSMQKSKGMVVGIVTPQGKRIITYGKAKLGDERVLNENTLFEIGSSTKLFTCLLLSDMVKKGEVKLNDPVNKYLPKKTKLPQFNGHPITLLDLATHTSGLPFQPSDLKVSVENYKSYSDNQLFNFVSNYKLTAKPGTVWTYSNLGIGLLAKALSNRAGKDYAVLIKERITAPLKLENTVFTLSSKQNKILAQGYDAKGVPAPQWSLPSMAGAGSLKSTTTDLLKFLSAFMGLQRTPLLPAMQAMFDSTRPAQSFMQALGWWVIPFGQKNDYIYAMGGQTFGYTSSIAYDPVQKIGVVVLSNSEINDGGLAWHILRSSWPVETSKTKQTINSRKEIVIDLKLLDLYIGTYQFESSGGTIAIERSGNNLIMKSSTTPPDGLKLYPESQNRFFIKEAELEVTFDSDLATKAASLVLRFGGKDYTAKRMN